MPNSPRLSTGSELDGQEGQRYGAVQADHGVSRTSADIQALASKRDLNLRFRGRIRGPSILHSWQFAVGLGAFNLTHWQLQSRLMNQECNGSDCEPTAMWILVPPASRITVVALPGPLSRPPPPPLSPLPIPLCWA